MENTCPECKSVFTRTKSGIPQKFCGVGCRNRAATRASRPFAYGRIKLGLEPKEAPTPINLAWVIGFYEGEGTAGFNSKTTRVSIGQKQQWPLDKCQRWFGGTITKLDKIYMWSISGELARRFLAEVYCGLSPRRKEQADKALGPPRV